MHGLQGYFTHTCTHRCLVSLHTSLASTTEYVSFMYVAGYEQYMRRVCKCMHMHGSARACVCMCVCMCVYERVCACACICMLGCERLHVCVPEA